LKILDEIFHSCIDHDRDIEFLLWFRPVLRENLEGEIVIGFITDRKSKLATDWFPVGDGEGGGKRIEKVMEKVMEKGEVKGLPGGEESPEKGRSPILLGQREKPPLLRRGERRCFFTKRAWVGRHAEDRNKIIPPPRSCMSFTLPSEPATKSGKLKEKKFIV